MRRMPMHFRRSLVTLAVVLGTAAAADAGSLASGPAYSNGQSFADCLIRNIGTASVNVLWSNIVIYGDGVGVLPITNQSCSAGPLAPGALCGVRANAVSGAMSCSATVPGVASKFRGSFEIRDASDHTLVHEALR